MRPDANHRPSQDTEAPDARKRDDESWKSMTEAWKRLRGHVPTLTSHALAYGALQAERIRISLRDLAFRIVLGVLLATAGLTAAVAATVYVAQGLTGAFTALSSGRSWVGELAGGIVLLAFVLTGFHRWTKGIRERNLERLRARFPSPERESTRGHVALEPQGPEL